MQAHGTGAASGTASPVLNHGYKIGPKRALKPKEVCAIRFGLGSHPSPRDRALFDLAIDSKLRGCDPVSGGRIRHRATVVQHGSISMTPSATKSREQAKQADDE